MPATTWMGAESRLTSAELTVRAQTVPLDNNGELIWDAFFEQRDVRSVVIQNILQEQEVRYTADRREYNTRGRLIPFDMVGTELIKVTPIESYFKLDEEEIQHYEEQADGNEEIFRRLVGQSIPERINRLARANNRRIEVDVFRAWSGGQITVRNPQLGHLAQTFSYGIAAARYNTAATAWNDPGENAYSLFRQWVKAAEQYVGRVGGVVLRQTHFDEILADCAAAITTGLTPIITPTEAEFRRRVNEELGRQFQFFIVENTLKEFGDGGVSNLTETDIWPTNKIAAVPVVGTPGFVAYAPVARAYELARVAPEAKINRNRTTIYVETAGNGREATFECQTNAMPILQEDKIYVTDVGF